MRDPALDRAEKGAVLQEQGVRLEDPRVLGAEALLHVPGRGLDLVDGGLGRPAEPLDLGLDLLRLESPLRRGILSRDPEHGTPDGDAGRYGDPGERKRTLHRPIVTVAAF